MKRNTYHKALSLYPLNFDTAIQSLLQVKPPKKAINSTDGCKLHPDCLNCPEEHYIFDNDGIEADNKAEEEVKRWET